MEPIHSARSKYAYHDTIDTIRQFAKNHQSFNLFGQPGIGKSSLITSVIADEKIPFKRVNALERNTKKAIMEAINDILSKDFL